MPTPARCTTMSIRAHNPAGPHREFWYHGAGCHAWLVVERDTRTHAIKSVASARQVTLARQRGGA